MHEMLDDSLDLCVNFRKGTLTQDEFLKQLIPFLADVKRFYNID